MRRFAAVLAAWAVIVGAGLALTLSPPSGLPAASAVPMGFNDQLYADGLLEPTAFALAPDGRLFVTEQEGRISIVRRGQAPVTFATVPTEGDGERGLLGIALHPGFATNGWVYVYWTDPAAAFAHRISRFTASGDSGGARSDLVLLDAHSAGNHNGGAMHFGPVDHKLYVATGDNANGANSQSLGNRHGKILRYNDDGSIPGDNPFNALATGANQAIYALGLRNPFTFNFDPSGIANINDVGAGDREEVSRLEAGANYGWPIYEGSGGGPGPGPLGPGNLRHPIYDYENTDQDGDCAITGGAFYSGTQFPPEYHDDWFFADYCGNWIRRYPEVQDEFVSGADAVVDLLSHPDGSLLYLDYGAGTVRVVTYGEQVAPTITSQPADVTYLPGQPVTFQVGASGAQPLLFEWQSEAGGGAWANVPGANEPSITIATQPGVAVPRHRVVVTNSAGSVTSRAATAVASTSAINIVSPAQGTRYHLGDTLAVAATGVDDTGNPLGLQWRVVFHHDFHTHPAQDWQPLAPNASFTVPDTGHDPGTFWYRFEFRATLPTGQEISAFRDVFQAETVDHFAPASPTRVVDTRTNVGGHRLAAGEVLEVPMPPPVSDAATAVAINLTSDAAAADGYLTAWPCGQPMPPTSTVNYVAGAPAAAGALVGLGGGKLCVFAYRDTDVIIDVTGWSDPYPTTTRSAQAIGPIRVEDTRLKGPALPAGTTHVLSLAAAGSGFGGNAVALNVTSVDTLADGYVTLWACDQPMPATSNLNVRAGETRPNLAIVPVAADGTVCAFTYGGGHLVVDVVAAFLPGLPGDIEPVAPVRLLDTRSGGTRVPAGGVVAVAAPPGAKAVALSLVATEPVADGYLTAYPCNQGPPLASNVNYRAGQSIANGTITPVAPDGTVCVTTYAATHVIVDLTGVFT